jgi:hypothetical protein
MWRLRITAWANLNIAQHAIKQYNVSTWEETFEILKKEYS